jgi:hypothetical protein
MGEQFSLSVQLPAQGEIGTQVGGDTDDSDSGMEWFETEWEGCRVEISRTTNGNVRGNMQPTSYGLEMALNALLCRIIFSCQSR